MSKVSSVADINGLPHKAIVYAFKGKVLEVGKFYSGTGKNNKAYAIQNLTVADESGERIKVKLDGLNEAPKDWRGREISIVAHNGDKGWSGAYAIDDAYEGKEERILKITPSAAVVCGDMSKQNALKGSESAPNGDPAPGSGGTQRAHGTKTEAANPAVAVMDAKRALAKAANLYMLVYDAAVHVANKCTEHHKDIEFTTDQFQALTASLFIYMDRRYERIAKGYPIGCDSFPIGDIHEFLDELKAAAQEQKKEKEFEKEKEKKPAAKKGKKK